MNPLLIAGASGIAGYGLASAVGSRRVPSIQTQPFEDIIQKGLAQRNPLIKGLPRQLGAVGSKYQSGVGNLLAKTQAENRLAGENYISASADTSGKLANSLGASVNQRILAAQPALAGQLRENLAATGGLQRGAANVAFTNLARDASAQISDAQTGITQQMLADKQAALSKVYGYNEDFLKNELGINAETLNALFQSGRADLVNEVAQLLDESHGAQADRMNIEQLRQTGNIASARADIDSRNAILAALLGGAGTAAGAYAGRK
jgi:hypothetical protein